MDQRHRYVATEQSIPSPHRRPRRAADELLLEDVSIGDDGRAVLRLHALSVCPAVFPTADGASSSGARSAGRQPGDAVAVDVTAVRSSRNPIRPARSVPASVVTTTVILP